MIVKVNPPTYNITVVHRRRGQYTTTSQFVRVMALCCLGRPGLWRKNKTFLCLDRNKKENYYLHCEIDCTLALINCVLYFIYVSFYDNNSVHTVRTKTGVLKKELKCNYLNMLKFHI